MAKNTLSVTDNRTGKSYEIPIEDGNVIRATALRSIKTGEDDFGLMSYDPALVNTEPYAGGWFFKVKVADPAELGSLLSPEQYAQQIGGA